MIRTYLRLLIRFNEIRDCSISFLFFIWLPYPHRCRGKKVLSLGYYSGLALSIDIGIIAYGDPHRGKYQVEVNPCRIQYLLKFQKIIYESKIFYRLLVGLTFLFIHPKLQLSSLISLATVTLRLRGPFSAAFRMGQNDELWPITAPKLEEILDNQ